MQARSLITPNSSSLSSKEAPSHSKIWSNSIQPEEVIRGDGNQKEMET